MCWHGSTAVRRILKAESKGQNLAVLSYVKCAPRLKKVGEALSGAFLRKVAVAPAEEIHDEGEEGKIRDALAACQWFQVISL